MNSLMQRDIKHIWHPYTNMSEFGNNEFPIIERSEGSCLYTTKGDKLYDAIASWWCVNLGHSHPRLIRAIQEQAAKLQHCIIGSVSHVPVIELTEELVKITPNGLDRVFFAGDGSSAVEVALKVALQYWYNLGESNRTKFICLEDGYHGDTLGSIGVGYVSSFHKPFEKVIPKSFRAASPHCVKCPVGKKINNCETECFSFMERLIEEHHQEAAAVIVEPLCQGAAGIRIYPVLYLQKLRRLCDLYNLPLIFDEIAVGFGRTGSFFAADTANVIPDIMTIGKGLTNGYLPMSAAIVNDKIYSPFTDYSKKDTTLYHGHTFSGNPITSALALEVLKIYSEQNIIKKTLPLQKLLKKGMAELSRGLVDSPFQTLGLIGVVYLNEQAGGAKRAKKIAAEVLKRGVLVRPLGESLYLWPPLTMSLLELNEIFEILQSVIYC